MKFWGVRSGNTVRASDADSSEELLKLPAGKAILFEAKQPRNPQYHRWFFAICHRIASGIGSDAETIANVFKHATGHVETIKTKSYGMVQIPKSISFAKLDETEFRAFVERCIQCAYDEWGIDPADLADLLAPMESQKR